MRSIKIASIIVLLAIFSMMSGCGYKEGVKTQERTAYLYFTGDAKGAEVSIDGAISFTVEKLGVDEQYKVSPGKHLITVTKGDTVVVKRELLLGDGVAREINVP